MNSNDYEKAMAKWPEVELPKETEASRSEK